MQATFSFRGFDIGQISLFILLPQLCNNKSRFAVPQQVLVSQLGSAVATAGSAQVVGAAGTAVAAPPPPTAVMQSMPIALTTVAAAAAAGNGLQQQLQTVQPQQIQQIQQVCSLAKIKYVF